MDITQIPTEQLQAALQSQQGDDESKAVADAIPDKSRPLAGLSDAELQSALQAHEYRQAQLIAPYRAAAPAEYQKLNESPNLRRFVGVLRDPIVEGFAGAARRRLDRGEQTPQDLRTLALYEHEKAEDAKREEGWGGYLQARATELPGQVAAVVAGGKVAGAGLRAAGITGKVAQVAAQTVATPSLYAHKAVQNNVEAGRDPLDPRGLPNAVALGMAQLAVFDAVGLAGAKVLPRVGPVGAAASGAVTMPLSQQVADAVTSFTGLDTGYGTIGQLVQGKGGEALKRLAGEALTGVAFGAMHGEHSPAVTELAGRLRQAKERGLPAAAAAEQASPEPSAAAPQPPPSQPEAVPSQPQTPRQQADALEARHRDLQGQLVEAQAAVDRLNKDARMGAPNATALKAARRARTRLASLAGPEGTLTKQLDAARVRAADQESPPPTQPAQPEPPPVAPESPEPRPAPEAAAASPEAAATPPGKPAELPPLPPDTARLTHFTTPRAAQAIIEGGSFRMKGGITSTTHAFSTNEQVQEQIQSGLAKGRYGNAVLLIDLPWDEYKAQDRSFSDKLDARHVIGWYDRDSGEFHANPRHAPTPPVEAPPQPQGPPASSPAEPGGEPTPITAATRTQVLDLIDRDAHGLTEREKTVLMERVMDGTSARDLGAKLGVSHQTAMNDEASALKKLGFRGTVDELHAAGRPAAPTADSRSIPDDDLHTIDPDGALHNALIQRITAAHDRLDELDRKQRKEELRGPLPAARKAYYRTRRAALRRTIDEGQGADRPAETAGGGPLPAPESGGTAPVQRDGGPGLRPDSPAGPAPPEGPPGAAAGHAAPAPAAAGGAAAGDVGYIPAPMERVVIAEEIAKLQAKAKSENQLQRAFTSKEIADLREAQRTGQTSYQRPQSPPEGYAAGRVNDRDVWIPKKPRPAGGAAAGDVGWQKLLDGVSAGDVTPENYGAKVRDLIAAIPRLDGVRQFLRSIGIAEKPAGRADAARLATSVLGNLVGDEQMRRRMAGGDVGRLITSLPEHADVQAAAAHDLRAGAPVPRAEQDLQGGLQAGYEAARAQAAAAAGAPEPNGAAQPAAGGAPGPAERLAPGAGQRAAGPAGEFGMGAAGWGGDVEPPPPPGTPGAKAPGAPEPPKIAPTTNWFQKAGDFLRGFGQQQFPALTRLAPRTSEKLSEAANAQHAAKSTWDHLSRILKIDKPLGDMTEEELRAAGTVWLERRARHLRASLQREGKDASKVAHFIGTEGSPLRTEADYQAGREALWPFWEAVKQEWTLEVEKNFRSLKDLDPEDEIDSPSQIPQLPLNAIPLLDADQAPGAVRTGRKQSLGNIRLRTPGFTRQASLSAPAYDVNLAHMMQKTLHTGIESARRSEALKAALADGVIRDIEPGERAPDGWRPLELRPDRGLQGLNPKGRYYAHPDVYQEFVQGFGIGDRPGQTLAGQASRFVSDKLTGLAVMTPVEVATHVGNHFTALFEDGMGVPIYNLKDSFANAWKVWQQDPEILRRVMELAKIGASFGHEARPGLLGAGGDAWLKANVWRAGDPSARLQHFVSGFIDAMQKGVRVQLDDAYSSLVRSGVKPDTQAARRDFINRALGSYNAQASGRITQFLKDTGLQPFAVAASTFTSQGARRALAPVGLATPTAENTTWANSAQVRATALLKFLPVLAIGPVVNSITRGQAFPTGIPAFTVQTGEDADTKKYLDPLAFTGIRRGWRATGINAAVEGSREGDTAGQMFDRAAGDLWHTAEHQMAGPGVQALHIGLTGENLMGHRVAPKVSTAKTGRGIAAAQARGAPAPGSSQYWENIKAAVLNANQMVGTLTGADRPKTPKGWWQTAMQSIGPFGEKEKSARKGR